MSLVPLGAGREGRRHWPASLLAHGIPRAPPPCPGPAAPEAHEPDGGAARSGAGDRPRPLARALGAARSPRAGLAGAGSASLP